MADERPIVNSVLQNWPLLPNNHILQFLNNTFTSNVFQIRKKCYIFVPKIAIGNRQNRI